MNKRRVQHLPSSKLIFTRARVTILSNTSVCAPHSFDFKLDLLILHTAFLPIWSHNSWKTYVFRLSLSLNWRSGTFSVFKGTWGSGTYCSHVLHVNSSENSFVGPKHGTCWDLFSAKNGWSFTSRVVLAWMNPVGFIIHHPNRVLCWLDAYSVRIHAF